MRKISLLLGAGALVANLGFFSVASATLTPPPTTIPTVAEDCKDGNWQVLTDTNGVSFKNQGDCVSFVTTNGKNTADGN